MNFSTEIFLDPRKSIISIVLITEMIPQGGKMGEKKFVWENNNFLKKVVYTPTIEVYGMLTRGQT